MKPVKRIARIGLGLAIGLCAALPGAAAAQDSTELPFPRNNVAGGAIATRRPGTWIQSGISTHATRQAASLHAFGGATITQTEPAPSIRDSILPTLVGALVAAIEDLSAAIQAAIQAGLAG